MTTAKKIKYDGNEVITEYAYKDSEGRVINETYIEVINLSGTSGTLTQTQYDEIIAGKAIVKVTSSSATTVNDKSDTFTNFWYSQTQGKLQSIIIQEEHSYYSQQLKLTIITSNLSRSCESQNVYKVYSLGNQYGKISLGAGLKINSTSSEAGVLNLDGVAMSSSLATVATSGKYSDLTGTPTIPTVNNGTLTIQKNGATVKTFTANSSTNVTANITVPTKTSELTNDSNYATISQLPTVNNGKLTIKVEGTEKGSFTANQSTASEINIQASDLGLTGAMKFVGKFDTLPETTDYEAGNVIIVGSKEYILIDNSGTKSWDELGDESSHALKSIKITGTGALSGGGTLAEDRAITHTAGSAASKSSGLYKFSTDAYSHVKAVTAVTKSDITALGIPGSDTNTTYTFANGTTNNILKISPSSGDATEITINDVTHATKADSATSATNATYTTYLGTSSSNYTKSTLDTALNGKQNSLSTTQLNACNSGITSDLVTQIGTNTTNISNHISNTSNPHSVTKSQVGLGSVINTGDSATPTSGGTTKFTTGGAYTLKSDLTSTINTGLNKKQDTLVSGTNIKTVDGNSLLGSGDISTAKTSTNITNKSTITGSSLTDVLNNSSVLNVVAPLALDTSSDATQLSIDTTDLALIENLGDTIINSASISGQKLTLNLTNPSSGETSTSTLTLPSSTVTVDSSISSSSTNPVQNKVIYNALSSLGNFTSFGNGYATIKKYGSSAKIDVRWGYSYWSSNQTPSTSISFSSTMPSSNYTVICGIGESGTTTKWYWAPLAINKTTSGFTAFTHGNTASDNFGYFHYVAFYYSAS